MIERIARMDSKRGRFLAVFRDVAVTRESCRIHFAREMKNGPQAGHVELRRSDGFGNGAAGCGARTFVLRKILRMHGLRENSAENEE